mmetsp:Transcript_12759/g.26925  ORF Transcript_12759/g.26925 Transcript_12759/m.26925 type:complete len:429 (-) Transcript_12759:248-1534(-)
MPTDSLQPAHARHHPQARWMEKGSAGARHAQAGALEDDDGEHHRGEGDDPPEEPLHVVRRVLVMVCARLRLRLAVGWSVRRAALSNAHEDGDQAVLGGLQAHVHPRIARAGASRRLASRHWLGPQELGERRRFLPHLAAGRGQLLQHPIEGVGQLLRKQLECEHEGFVVVGFLAQWEAAVLLNASRQALDVPLEMSHLMSHLMSQLGGWLGGLQGGQQGGQLRHLGLRLRHGHLAELERSQRRRLNHLWALLHGVQQVGEIRVLHEGALDGGVAHARGHHPHEHVRVRAGGSQVRHHALLRKLHGSAASGALQHDDIIILAVVIGARVAQTGRLEIPPVLIVWDKLKGFLERILELLVGNVSHRPSFLAIDGQPVLIERLMQLKLRLGDLGRLGPHTCFSGSRRRAGCCSCRSSNYRPSFCSERSKHG